MGTPLERKAWASGQGFAIQVLRGFATAPVRDAGACSYSPGTYMTEALWLRPGCTLICLLSLAISVIRP